MFDTPACLQTNVMQEQKPSGITWVWITTNKTYPVNKTANPVNIQIKSLMMRMSTLLCIVLASLSAQTAREVWWLVPLTVLPTLEYELLDSHFYDTHNQIDTENITDRL